MTKIIPFVGRQVEISIVMEYVKYWGTTCVMMISGEGGVGKSRLLQEVIQQYRTKQAKVLSLPVIDLFDPRLWGTGKVESLIVNGIGRESFESYQQILADIDRLQALNVSRDLLQRERNRALGLFVDSFNRYSERVRVIIAFDTLESVQNHLIQRKLIDLAVNLKNVMFIFAGRQVLEFYDELVTHLGVEYVQHLNLMPFALDEANQFISEELAYRHIRLSEEVKNRILDLTKNKAILIDLAIERVASTNSSQWLDAIDELADQQRRQTSAIFECDIVRYFANLGTYDEQLKLFMAHIRWVDSVLAARLLRIDQVEAEGIVARLSTLTHIKEYPSGADVSKLRIGLHDELARLINEHIYPEIDEDELLRQDKSRITAAYLKEQLDSLTQHLTTIDEDLKRQLLGDYADKIQLSSEKEGGVQEYWWIAHECLRHTLYAEPLSGVALFFELYDESTRQYRWQERSLLVELMYPYYRELGALALDNRYALGVRIVQHYIDLAVPAKAKAVLGQLVFSPIEDVGRQVELHRLMGNVLVRTGDLADAIDEFQLAADLARQQEDLKLVAESENALGWAYRLISYWEEAANHYREALVISRELGDLPLQASILNNLGFAYSYVKRQDALGLSQRAREIWEQLDDKRGIGVATATIAGIYYQMNRPTEALQYYAQVIPIFEVAQDRQSLARIYSWIGAAHISLGDLDEAEQYLQKALLQDIVEVKAQALCRLARVYFLRQDLDRAEALLKESYATSRQVYDVLYEIAALRDLIHLAVKKQMYYRYSEFANLVNQFESQWQTPDAHTQGSTYLYLALLVLGQHRKDTNLPRYLLRKAFQLLVEYGSYSHLSPRTYLKEVDDFLRSEVKTEVIQDIGNYLWEQFNNRGVSYELALDYFNRWRKIGAE